MAKKNAAGKADGILASRVGVLEKKVAKLEADLENRPSRRKREYTDEERKAIRARLLAGQEAARERREAEAKATKKLKQTNYDEVKPVEARSQ